MNAGRAAREGIVAGGMARRGANRPGVRDAGIGFRLVRSLGTEPTKGPLDH